MLGLSIGMAPLLRVNPRSYRRWWETKSLRRGIHTALLDTPAFEIEFECMRTDQAGTRVNAVHLRHEARDRDDAARCVQHVAVSGAGSGRQRSTPSTSQWPGDPKPRCPTSSSAAV